MKKISIIIILLFFYPNTSFSFFDKAIISGTVKNHVGNPIQGVQVKVKNSRFTSLTDKKGEYNSQYMPGTFTVIYSKQGYSKHELTLNLVTKEEFPAEDVILIKLPKEKGVYYYGANPLLLKENHIGMAGTYLESIQGIKKMQMENYFMDNQPLFLIYGEDYLLENISIDKLKFTGVANVQNIGGKRASRIDMWTSDGIVPFKLIKSSSADGVVIGLIQLSSPLKTGDYALHWGSLHAKEPLSLSAMQKAVFDFHIPMILSEKDKEEIKIKFDSLIKLVNGDIPTNKSSLNKIIHYKDSDSATDADIAYFLQEWDKIKIDSVKDFVINPVFTENWASIGVTFIYNVKGIKESQNWDNSVCKVNGSWFIFCDKAHN